MHVNVMTVVCCPFQVQYLTLMGMELHARSRRDLEPDPEFDPICALFYCLSSDGPLPNVDGTQLTGAIVVDKDHQSCDRGEKKKPSALSHRAAFSTARGGEFLSTCSPPAGHRGTAPLLVRSGVSELQVTYAADEKALFEELIAIVRRCVGVVLSSLDSPPSIRNV